MQGRSTQACATARRVAGLQRGEGRLAVEQLRRADDRGLLLVDHQCVALGLAVGVLVQLHALHRPHLPEVVLELRPRRARRHAGHVDGACARRRGVARLGPFGGARRRRRRRRRRLLLRRVLLLGALLLRRLLLEHVLLVPQVGGGDALAITFQDLVERLLGRCHLRGRCLLVELLCNRHRHRQRVQRSLRCSAARTGLELRWIRRGHVEATATGRWRRRQRRQKGVRLGGGARFRTLGATATATEAAEASVARATEGARRSKATLQRVSCLKRSDPRHRRHRSRHRRLLRGTRLGRRLLGRRHGAAG